LHQRIFDMAQRHLYTSGDRRNSMSIWARPISMSLSLSIACHYKPYYVTCVFLLSSV
jgi:hypothetical protein